MAVDAATSSRAAAALLRLDHPDARDPAVAGAKAAALARARAAGLPVLPGWVLTTQANPADVARAAREIWSDMPAATATATAGGRSLVVRSSSTVEDGSRHSMAGLFRSVTGVRSEPELAAAIEAVLESARSESVRIVPLAGHRAAMAVLIQPELPPAPGGVLFGLDPVSGHDDRFLVVVSPEGPIGVVQGETGEHASISRRGRRLGADHPLTRSQSRRLARLGRHAEGVFGGPQDVEWGTDTDGRVWMLQSRPVTAVGAGAPPRRPGPVLGPAALAETFPDPLAPLEAALWVEPLGEAVGRALGLVGMVSARRLHRGPVVLTVGGWVAGDLAILANGPRATPGLRNWVDPSRWGRRLVAAWRVGRLRAALPALAAGLLQRADAELAAVDRLEHLSDATLLRILDGTRVRLLALHGHEVLMGLLVSTREATVTGAGVALQLLASGRAEGLTDEELVARHPSVLALLPPRIGSPPALPPVSGPPTAAPVPDSAAELREALRLRARWVQELGARAAAELGRRLAARGILATADHVRWLRFDELRAATSVGVVPGDLGARAEDGFGPPLPARFRLDGNGHPVAIDDAVAEAGRRAGTGAGGGRGQGVVHQGGGPPPPGAVWVVASLDPRLAAWLPDLSGLVAETGSPLSHLAILAREFGVPAVVGVASARERFPTGAHVLVDGHSGEVTLLADPPAGRSAPDPSRRRGAA